MEATDQNIDIVAACPIVATAGTRYRITHYIMVVVIAVMAGWFAYDGFYNWPRQIAENNAADAAGKPREHKPRTRTDILIQQALAISLPLAGLALLLWCLRQSRGQIRFEDGILTVPGHPPVSLAEMRSIDNERWDKKGVALIGYECKAGRGTIKLDDYHYTREPVDKIQKLVTVHLTPKKPTAVPLAIKPPPRPSRNA